MSRGVLAAVVALALLAVPSAAAAHPLGNFSVNHLTVARVSAGGVALRYVLDQAEIPTFQQRSLAPSQVLAGVRGVVARGVSVRADGRPVALRVDPGGRLRFPRGQGGLPTTRVELLLRGRPGEAGALEIRDATFAGRVGWRAVIVRPGRATAVRSDVPSADPTHGLRVYPRSLLTTPADRPVAHLAVRPGDGSVTAPGVDGAGSRTTRDRGAGDGLAAVFGRGAAGHGVLVLLLLAAFGWGAVHALSPGHGKAMVAAYLVGARGTARHAVALGLIVTATHTAGVFALGVVTLGLSAYVLPEDLYPWLNLASGVLVLGVGIAVLRARTPPAPAHAHGGRHHDHHSHHGHVHVADGPISRRSLVAMGASAGLLPCPSALVVLLAAIAQHQVALGLAFIAVFSAGLATTLTTLGVLVVRARGLAGRLGGRGRALAALPALSAAVIVAVGVVLTVRAMPAVL